MRAANGRRRTDDWEAAGAALFVMFNGIDRGEAGCYDARTKTFRFPMSANRKVFVCCKQ